jgi:rfaE bifunctional protein kinase chain/domain
MIKRKVLVIGDVMLDEYWNAEVSRISPEAPVPVANVNSLEVRLGGAANVAHNLVKAGVEVELLGVIGVDEDGRKLQEMCSKLGMKHLFFKSEDLVTTKKLRVISKNHQMIRCDFEKLFYGSLLDFINFEQILYRHEIVVFSDYKKGALNSIGEMLKISKRLKKTSIVDPKLSDLFQYSNTFLLKPNYSEFKNLFRCSLNDHEVIFKKLNEFEIEHLAVTCSDDGVKYFNRGGHFKKIDAEASELYDVTGAGDTFAASVAFALSNQNEMEQALGFANACSGLVVGKMGTSTLSQLEFKRLKEIWL